MHGTRYEFGNTGIFHALSLFDDCDMDWDDSNDLAWAEECFDRELHAVDPSKEIGADCALTFFFTDKGRHVFKEQLDVMEYCFVQYLENAGLGEFKQVDLDIDATDVVYQDEYQFAITKDRYQQIMTAKLYDELIL